jgi:hypothetical protein
LPTTINDACPSSIDRRCIQYGVPASPDRLIFHLIVYCLQIACLNPAINIAYSRACLYVVGACGQFHLTRAWCQRDCAAEASSERSDEKYKEQRKYQIAHESLCKKTS